MSPLDIVIDIMIYITFICKQHVHITCNLLAHNLQPFLKENSLLDFFRLNILLYCVHANCVQWWHGFLSALLFEIQNKCKLVFEENRCQYTVKFHVRLFRVGHGKAISHHRPLCFIGHVWSYLLNCLIFNIFFLPGNVTGSICERDWRFLFFLFSMWGWGGGLGEMV